MLLDFRMSLVVNFTYHGRTSIFVLSLQLFCMFLVTSYLSFSLSLDPIPSRQLFNNISYTQMTSGDYMTCARIFLISCEKKSKKSVSKKKHYLNARCSFEKLRKFFLFFFFANIFEIIFIVEEAFPTMIDFKRICREK